MGHDTGQRNTTHTSLRILEAVKGLDGARVSEIAERLQLPDSTVHSHLKTLEEERYVTKEGDIYHVGLKLFTLGEYARRRKEIHVKAMATVDEVVRQTGEDADFSVLDDDRILVLYDEFSKNPHPGFQIGNHYHMHSSAAGKAMLAHLPEERITSILDRWGMPAVTENTITDRAELLSELDVVADRGYAVHREENHIGIIGVGAVITDSLDRIAGAIAVYGPKYRFPDVEDVATDLLSSVAELQAEIDDKSLHI